MPAWVFEELDLILYKIRDWNKEFENNRSRTVESLTWIAIPNRHDGENYTTLITSKDAAEIFSAWVLIVQVASRCQPRGTLLRGDGRPHDPASMSLKTRAPKIWFEKAFKFLTEHTDWLEITEVADGCQAAVRQVTGGCQAGDEGGKGKDRKEGGKGSVDVTYHKDSRTALHWLNEKSGKHFRETDPNLTFISERLKEPGVDIEGVKQMVQRQCQMWHSDPKMERYLRPETLFNETKFDAYYAARAQPIQVNGEVQPQQKQLNSLGMEMPDFQ